MEKQNICSKPLPESVTPSPHAMDTPPIKNSVLGVGEDDGISKTVMDNGYKNESSTSKSKNIEKNSVKVEDTYKDFFVELDLEQEDDDDDEMGLEKPSVGNIGKATLKNESLSGKKSEKPYGGMSSHVATMIGNGLGSHAAVPVVAPVVQQDWVCCDKCEKWRLLPPGVNPTSLPDKWLCSMLDWLPGMNRCSISEEETTKATTSCFPGPSAQGSQPVHPSGPQLGVISHDASQTPHAGLKKKHGSKDFFMDIGDYDPHMALKRIAASEMEYRKRKLLELLGPDVISKDELGKQVYAQLPKLYEAILDNLLKHSVMSRKELMNIIVSQFVEQGEFDQQLSLMLKQAAADWLKENDKMSSDATDLIFVTQVPEWKLKKLSSSEAE